MSFIFFLVNVAYLETSSLARSLATSCIEARFIHFYELMRGRLVASLLLSVSCPSAESVITELCWRVGYLLLNLNLNIAFAISLKLLQTTLGFAFLQNYIPGIQMYTILIMRLCVVLRRLSRPLTKKFLLSCPNWPVGHVGDRARDKHQPEAREIFWQKFN